MAKKGDPGNECWDCNGVRIYQENPWAVRWEVAQGRWEYRFLGGLLTRNGLPAGNLKGSLATIVQWSKGYEHGLKEGEVRWRRDEGNGRGGA